VWVFLVCGVVIPQTPHVVLVLILAPLIDTTYVVCVCARVCYSHLTDTQRGARARASTAHRISVMMGVCVCVLVCIIIILQTHNVTLALMLACLTEIYCV